MSIYKSSSLAMLPTAYKDGKLYSVRPTDGSGDFTFSRGSNLAATRVASSGYIEKGRENLLLQSNQFDTTWTLSSASITGGHSGYDGTNTAWELERTGTSGFLYQVNAQSGVITFSFYAKENSLSWLRVVVDSGTNADAYINLSDGSVGGGSSYIDVNTYDVGNDWYRISITHNDTAHSNYRIYPAVNDGDISGTSGSIYIQDAQLESGLVATDYIETGASTAQAGILEDMPRLDYSGGASCPALLLEPQRTNSILHSEYIASWAGANTTIVTNAAISPEGVQNASSVTFSAGGYWYKSIAGSYTAGSTHIWSIYANTSTRVVQWGGFTPAGTSVYDIEDVGNGWYRQTLTRTTTGSGSGTFQPLMDSVYVGVGTEFKVYGAQLEYNASYPTSYIPTYGSSVTRLSDSCSNTSASDLIGQSEGTLFAEVDFDAISEESRFIQISDGTNNNRFYIGALTTNNINYTAINGGTTIVNISSGAQSSGIHKVAAAYANNDFVLYIDGTQIAADTSGSVPAMDEVSIGYNNIVNNRHIAYGINQAVLFPSRLTDTELASLTTL